MKIILLIFTFFIFTSCGDNNSNIVLNIDTEIVNSIIDRDNENNVDENNVDENNVDENNIETLSYKLNNGYLSLEKRIELINLDEELKKIKFLNTNLDIESNEINIIKGNNEIKYLFKYIKNVGIELCGIGLSDNIKNITITPVPYNIINNKDLDLELKENKIDFIKNTESFTLTIYKKGNKSFLYNAFFYFNLFSKEGANYEIKYEFEDGTIDKDYIFIKGKY